MTTTGSTTAAGVTAALIALATLTACSTTEAAPLITPAAVPTTKPTLTPTSTVTPTPTPTRATPTVKPSPTGNVPNGAGQPLGPNLPSAPAAYYDLPAAQRNAIRDSLLSFDKGILTTEAATRTGLTGALTADFYATESTVFAINEIAYIQRLNAARYTLTSGHERVTRFLPVSASASKVTLVICLSKAPTIVDKNKKPVSGQNNPNAKFGFVDTWQFSTPNWLFVASVDAKKSQNGKVSCA